MQKGWGSRKREMETEEREPQPLGRCL